MQTQQDQQMSHQGESNSKNKGIPIQQSSHPQYHQNNGWTTRGEKLVRYWQEECRLYAWMYEQNATYYSRLNRTLGIASIALSAITGTTLFNQSASDPDATSSNILIGLGVSSIASTILSGLKELLDLNSLITQNTNAARENSSIVMDIDEQMNIDRDDRVDGREFMKSIKDRKNALIQNGPIIPSRQWKQVHRKIQSKEQLGFLNREVFNEYLEQSVDINKLQFGGQGVNNGYAGGFATNGIDYGTPTNNPSGSVTINMTEQPKLHKRATLSEKMAYYGGLRQQIMPIIQFPPKPIYLETLEKELENLQPRCAARKILLENQYELERLISKSGELKNKDRHQIANLRDKAYTCRENYQKLVNEQFGDYNSIINTDCQRVAKIIRAYRDGELSEPELFRIIQLDLMEIDNETFQDKTRIIDLITKTRQKLDFIKEETELIANKQKKEADELRYPFRTFTDTEEPPYDNNPNTDRDIHNQHLLLELLQRQELTRIQLAKSAAELNHLYETQHTNNHSMSEELEIKISDMLLLHNELAQEYDVINAKIAEVNTANQTMNTGYTRVEATSSEIDNAQRGITSSIELVSPQSTISNISYTPQFTSRVCSNLETNVDGSVSPIIMSRTTSNQQNSETVQNPLNNRPASTAPSDDEFIENMISDNLCSKQLQDMIKPVMQPSSLVSPSGYEANNSNTKSPKRRGGKYDAQMRYQTSRFN